MPAPAETHMSLFFFLVVFFVDLVPGVVNLSQSEPH